MMVLSARRPDASLLEFLAMRARSSSVRRLTVDALTGVALVAAMLRWDSAIQILAVSIGVCLLAYGVWGLLDRAGTIAQAKGWSRITGAADALRMLAVLFGIIAAVGVLLSVWALALGTWIS